MASMEPSLGERHLMRHTPFDAKELARITGIPNWDTDFTHCEIEFRDPLYPRILRFVQEVREKIYCYHCYHAIQF